MDLVVGPEDPTAPDVRAVLDRHLAFARAVTPPDGVHALDVDGLLGPAVTFVGARLDGTVVGVGALAQLDPVRGELKSVHTVEAARGQGVGRAVVEHLLAVAEERGCRWVGLETGVMAAFDPARALYARIGFRPCAPFGGYRSSPTSACMELVLRPDP